MEKLLLLLYPFVCMRNAKVIHSVAFLYNLFIIIFIYSLYCIFQMEIMEYYEGFICISRNLYILFNIAFFTLIRVFVFLFFLFDD